MPKGSAVVGSEERLIPVIRAALAERMARDGFSGSEIAASLRVSRSAVTQYLKRTRGRKVEGTSSIAQLVEPLAEKIIKRARSNLGPVETIELLETARQVMVVDAGKAIVQSGPEEPHGDAKSLTLLRERLQLELAAAEQYLQLANRTTDDYTKLLFRMIASDSLRHGDVISQVISWLESDSGRRFELPGRDILESMLALEDSAKEISLRESIKVDHPVARLLLESIDMDEAKHGKMVTRMLSLDAKRQGRIPDKT
jgi:predicted transcriptional regulator/bacterioferritin (cytochrome b1)